LWLIFHHKEDEEDGVGVLEKAARMRVRNQRQHDADDYDHDGTGENVGINDEQEADDQVESVVLSASDVKIDRPDGAKDQAEEERHMADVTASIVDFLRGIGIDVRQSILTEPTFLPGVTIDRGALVYDPAQLKFPGDLLHEAGHIAMTPASDRAAMSGTANPDGGIEMGAIAWSWAALLHLGLEPEILFHADGYRGASRAYAENFRSGHFFGVPMLEYAGLTEEKTGRKNPAVAYPKMLKWLRE
jgi:hypothetical protein